MTARTAPGATGRVATKRAARIRRISDVDAVRSILETAPAYSAYALAYLDPHLFPLAEFYQATAGDNRAMIMHARGGLGPSTFTIGEPALVGALVQLHPGQRQAFLTCETTHVDEILETHNLWRPQTMLRMQVDRDHFVRPDLHFAANIQCRRLIDADADDLNRLYALEDDGLRYSGRQVSDGVYYGVYSRGRLVSAAGTHIFSSIEGVAVVGNVFTHPDHRGHGFGTASTAAVTEHLLQSCRLIVLNVDPANRPARHIYDTLGYREHGRLMEAMSTRRSSITPIPAVRRAFARWRSGTPGVEVVEL
ncbi:MAG: GNAT family N-acetyltransferase [Dehalococcoidia bacterium]